MLRFLLLLFLSPLATAGVLTLGTTSTTTNSGLMDYLLPYYTQQTGHEVRVITGGTGFILQQLERGDVQLAITHQKESEEALLAKFPQGKRQPFMYNHFLIIGPADDPADIVKATSFTQVFYQIYTTKSVFLSRGDRSGSHIFELNIWNKLEIDPAERLGRCYLESGQDMGPTINMAAELQAYMIVDEGTWAAYANRSQLKPLYKGLDDSRNEYSLLQLQDSTYLPPEATEFISWLFQADTLGLIDNFKIVGKKGFSSSRK
jgi:tungstate transport system substrate-binding protein